MLELKETLKFILPNSLIDEEAEFQRINWLTQASEFHLVSSGVANGR